MSKSVQSEVSGGRAGVSDGEIMGRNEYARHQGVTPGAVAKAVRSGRITRAVVWDGHRIKGIRWRLADELWMRNTDPTEAVKGRKSLPPAIAGTLPVPVQTSARDAHGRLGQLLGEIFADALVPWCGLSVSKYGIFPDVALNIAEDGLLVLMTAAAERLGAGADEFRVVFDRDLGAVLTPDRRAELVERIRAVAAGYK
jgi:hypothetical protein